jgi:prenyltransferase beta subunit
MDALAMLTGVTCAVASAAAIDTVKIRAATIRILRQMSILHDGRSVRGEKLASWFSSTQTASVLRATGSWGSRLSEGDWIAAQLWRRKQDHALRWIALWAALEWKSVEHATSTLAVTLTGTAVEESGQLGLFPLTETPVLTPVRLSEAIETLSSYDEVQVKLGITRSTLIRWLEHDPDLRAAWKGRKRSEGVAKALHDVLTFVRTFPQTSPSDLERELPRQVRNLRKQAPDRLRLIVSSLPSRLPAQLPLELWLKDEY